MQWLQTRLSQPSFPFLLEDACRSEGLIPEREGSVNEAEALICVRWAHGSLHGGGGCCSSPAIPQGSPQASHAWRPQACGASLGFPFLICETSQPCPAHWGTHRLFRASEI